MANIRYNDCITDTNILGLRTADHLRFDYLNESTTEILCTKAVRDSQGVEKTREHTFEIFSSVIVESNPNLKLKAVSASFTMPWSFYNWEVQTAFKMLERGNEVELLWLPDRTPFAFKLEGDAKKIFMDVLKLIIFKNDTQFHYVLGTHVCTEENRLINFGH